MRVEEFSNNIYEQMENELTEIRLDNTNLVQSSRELSSKIILFIQRLKIFINPYKFENKFEEINFFKNIKPKFLSKLIYHKQIFEIQSRLPVGLADINSYYFKHLNKINNYFEDNKDFLIYYRANSTLLDEIYFTRKDPSVWFWLNSDEYDNDYSFTTIYDNILSKILAYEDISEFIMQSLNKLGKTCGTDIKHNINNPQTVMWTGSKAGLIELLYAIQTSGACNNGTLEVKQLANHFEDLFNVKLGNFYRTFQEIRIRKISRTSFLDHLKENLIKRMDNSDENPRF